MKTLFEPFTIKKTTFRNRIGLPPMVCFTMGNNQGLVSDQHIVHYREIAQGGVGFIIQEATCVLEDGRLSDTQLGMWNDQQLPGLQSLVQAVHAEGCPILVQIHHAGLISISSDPMAPSRFTARGKTSHEMSLEEIRQVQDAFVEAAKKAVVLGYDGIELHGCHSYLISQFYNRKVNQRQDEYGQDKNRFTLEILIRIKQVVPADFLVGIRLGGFEPTLEEAIEHARLLEQHGIDFIDVSYGFSGQEEIELPKNTTLKDIHYAAQQIKKAVKVPVFTVNGIRSKEDAEKILEESNVDALHLGKNHLVDPAWVNHIRSQQLAGKCLNCVRCMHYSKPELCPGRLLFQRLKK